jgi:hypothetical protein
MAFSKKSKSGFEVDLYCKIDNKMCYCTTVPLEEACEEKYESLYVKIVFGSHGNRFVKAGDYKF